MLQKNKYTILLVFTGAILALIFIFSKKEPKKELTFRERTGPIALSAEWLNTKEAMKGLIEKIEINPNDLKAKLNLVQAYIQESRITGDHAYYDKAALQLLDDVLKKEPTNFDALCCKATVLLSQHHFSEALVVAKEASTINPHNSFVYGLMCDAYVELGNYTDAVKVTDKMMSIRPDIRSYARVSYLREIHGDLPGAIEAAKLAVSAGYPGLEQTAWSRMILAHLYENIGALDSAKHQYQLALQERPDYAFAIAGLGKIEKANGNYKAAITYYEKAKQLIIEYSFSDELTDLYKANKDNEKANASAKEVIDMLSPIANVDEAETGHGHYADRELAYAYLKTNDTDNALKHANIELARRPDNIDVCEVTAWVNYKKGDYAKATALINKALRTQCKNPNLLCRAGLIKIKSNDVEKGKELIQLATKTNPLLDLDIKQEIKPYLN